MQRKPAHELWAAIIAMLVCRQAWAASYGLVVGNLGFYENEGNFCPTSRDCTGAKYLQEQYNTTQAIANVKVYVERVSDGEKIGQSTTDDSGLFGIFWYDPSTSGDTNAQIAWYGEQKDLRFRITASDGGSWRWWWPVTLSDRAVTNVGWGVWGWSGGAHALSNLYSGAQRMWANSLSQTNRMDAYFSGVEIRAFDETACSDTTKGTSCANEPLNRITIGSENSAYKPQARVQHEMGHIASYRASRDQSRHSLGSSDYNFGGSRGWAYDTAEYAEVQFEEGVATHLSTVALYYEDAVSPFTCDSEYYCPIGGILSFNLETSSGTNCGTNENRWPINAMRYFWDNYDSNTDYPGENLSRGVWEVVDTIDAFDNGTSNRQKDEMWNSSFTSLIDRDGRSCIDFRENWITWGTDSTTQLANNCGSAGD